MLAGGVQLAPPVRNSRRRGAASSQAANPARTAHYSGSIDNPETTMHPIRTIACLALSLFALHANAADLTIRVQDVSSAQGTVMVALYDGAGSFLRKPVQTAHANAATGAVDIVIKDLPARGYGIAVFHDANGNGTMDRNAIGIPVEDHAFSNNARGVMGPPSFEQVKFTLPAAGATATISLR